MLAEYKVPELQAAWEEKMRDVEAHQGRFAEWDFQFQAFRILLDNALKILHRDPARRTKQQQDALTDYFIKNYSAVAGKEFYEKIKFQELNDKLNKLAATLPVISLAPVIQENDEPPKTLHPRARRLAGPRSGSAARHAGLPAAAARRREAHAADAGQVDRLARQSAHRARGRESHVAGVVRARPGAHLGGFRHGGREAVASGTARLAGGGVHGSRLGHEAHGPADGDVRHLPAVVEGAAGADLARSGEFAAGAAIAPAPAGGADSRRGAGGIGAAEYGGRRQERASAAAGGRGRAVL